MPRSSGPTLWVHAVSVGEVNVAASLRSILPEGRPLLVTTVTPSGQERARSLFTQDLVTYLPFRVQLCCPQVLRSARAERIDSVRRRLLAFGAAGKSAGNEFVRWSSTLG